MPEYYVMSGKTRLGPYSIEDLEERQLLKRDALFCLVGEESWQKLQDIPILSDPELRNIAKTESAKSVEIAFRQPVRPDECPKTWMTETIGLLLFCIILGIPALIYALKVEPAYNRGEYEQAAKWSAKAKSFFIGGIIVVIVIYLYLLFTYFGH